jgi:DNA-binding transcriptional regulator YiaG
MADQYVHGTIALGEANGASRLKELDVKSIRSLFGTISQRKIAARFNVSPETIAKIRRGETWAWLP